MSRFVWYGVLVFLLALSAHAAEAGSCAGSCGGSVGDCWCDDACVQFGDCCQDACPQCNVCRAGSCLGSCGLQSGACWCDDVCDQYGDCCTDVCESCAIPSCELKGAVCSYGQADCNPYVSNVASSVYALRNHGDIMGFRMGSYPDVTMWDHWQGVQRVMTGGGRYLMVSSDHDDWSRFAVVRMGSRSTDGNRWRSNRLVRGVSSWDVTPSSVDVVVSKREVSSILKHAGGLQAIGNYLGVPLEEDTYSNRGKVVLYDVSSPENPIWIWQYILPTNHGAAVALAKLQDGRFLMVTARLDTEILDFYLSTTTTLTSPGWNHLTTWRKDSNWEAYQALGLVTEQDGDLYLIGTHMTGYWHGDDWIDAYRLNLSEDGDVTLTKVANRHLYCGTPGGRQCNLDAGAGVYVTPDHRLYLYATEHDNDGPSGSVKMMEFRPDPHRSSCTSMQNAFVELYKHSNFDGRSAMLDYRDRSLRNIDNFRRLEDLTDEISSVRWCLPSGHSFHLFRHDTQRGGVYSLRGNGSVQSDSSLHNDKFSDGSRVGDESSSGRWD